MEIKKENKVSIFKKENFYEEKIVERKPRKSL
jgi:hypothetical protein